MSVKKVLSLFVALGALSSVTAVPALTESRIPTVNCISPQQISYHKQINASGTIEAKSIREIYLDTPVIAKSVEVAVGDSVQKDQIIATIDSDLTKSVLSQSIPSADLLQSLDSLSGSMDLASIYSMVQNMGLSGNLGSVENLLQTYAASSNTQPANEYLYIPTQITAPMDGVITQIELKSDVLSRTSKPLITITDTNQFIAFVTVGESLISDIQVGDEAIIQGTGFNRQYSGYVSKIYPTARKQLSGTTQETVVDVEITINEPDQSLKPGFSARAEILTGTQRDLLIVPYEAVLQDEDNTEYVYVIADSRVQRRDIIVGMELLEGVEVSSGLEAGDVIIEDASVISKEGTRVHLKA